jgi:hypothetical protein
MAGRGWGPGRYARVRIRQRASAKPCHSAWRRPTTRCSAAPAVLPVGRWFEPGSGSHFFGPQEHRASSLNRGLAALLARCLGVSALYSAQLRLPGIAAGDSLSVRTQTGAPKPTPLLRPVGHSQPISNSLGDRTQLWDQLPSDRCNRQTGADAKRCGPRCWDRRG